MEYYSHHHPVWLLMIDFVGHAIKDLCRRRRQYVVGASTATQSTWLQLHSSPSGLCKAPYNDSPLFGGVHQQLKRHDNQFSGLGAARVSLRGDLPLDGGLTESRRTTASNCGRCWEDRGTRHPPVAHLASSQDCFSPVRQCSRA